MTRAPTPYERIIAARAALKAAEDPVIDRIPPDLYLDEWLVMAAIDAGAASPSAVCKALSMSASQVSRKIQTLKATGMLSREQSDADGRHAILRLTPAGTALVKLLPLAEEPAGCT